MTPTKNITSFTEHRQHLREHRVGVSIGGVIWRAAGLPDTAQVVLNPEAYDALADKAELAESLALLELMVPRRQAT